jgi:hypothetical protein
MRSLIDAGGVPPWLDIGSYGRRGPGRRDRFSQAQIEFISRTVNRVPEVMVKMLNQGGTGLRSVGRHVDYLDRDGELEIHTDEGERLKGRDASAALIDDWDLAIEEGRRTAELKPRLMRKSPKLVHKILFSMPPGTPPEKVLGAVKTFAREEFATKHRYAMVLHTDEPHPHVHMVVKALGEDGTRLNVRRDTLRYWRREFARHLRAHGVPANATERAVRGKANLQKGDGIYRATARGESTFFRTRVEEIARKLGAEDLRRDDPQKTILLKTRQQVVKGWQEIAESLAEQNRTDLALAVRAFVDRLPPVRTEQEELKNRIVQQTRIRRQTRDDVYRTR